MDADRDDAGTGARYADSRQKRPAYKESDPMRTLITNKQLLYLLFCSVVILFVGMGLFPLLPLYVAQFGSTPTVTGFYLAFIYATNAAGAMLTGWLAERLTHKGLFIAVGGLGMPALVLLGQATALWQVVVLTGIIWFSGGVGLALVNVLTGLYADATNRGAAFSLLFLAFPLGAVFGGATVGQLVAWQGYPLMFGVLGIVWSALPVIGLLGFKNQPRSRPAPAPAVTGATGQ